MDEILETSKIAASAPHEAVSYAHIKASSPASEPPKCTTMTARPALNVGAVGTDGRVALRHRGRRAEGMASNGIVA